MGGVAEHIGRGLINGDGTGIGSGVGLFLTDVKLQGLKFIVTHGKYLFHVKIQMLDMKKAGARFAPGLHMA